MRTHVLKINMSNIGHQIEKNYFHYRDLFYRCLVVNLCVYDAMSHKVLSSTIIEDSHYNQYLLHLAQRQASLQELISEIDPTHAVTTFLDTQLYMEEFLNAKHDDTLSNLYSLTIDDMYNIVITNKQLKRHHAN